MTDFKLFMSFVSPNTLDFFINSGLLPIFIIRNIKTSDLIGKYSETALHIKELSPSNELYQRMRDGLLSFEEYAKKYTIEMSEVNLYSVIEKIKTLIRLSGAKTAILLDYNGKFYHHSILAGILNNMGIDTEELCQENLKYKILL